MIFFLLQDLFLFFALLPFAAVLKCFWDKMRMDSAFN